MIRGIKRVVNFVICSGIVTGSSYLTAVYLQNEIKNIFVQGISKAINSPDNIKKFEALSEKMLKRMLEDQRNLFKLSEAVIKLIKKKKFKHYSALSISKPFSNEEIIHYFRLFIEINFYAYLRNYNIRQEELSIIND